MELPAQQESNNVDTDTLRGLEPVSSLSHERLEELAGETVVEVLPAGAVLFEEGDDDRQLIYLLNGELELRSSLRREPRIVTAGMPESWQPIGNKHPRLSTGTALSEVEIIRIDADRLDTLLTWDQVTGFGDARPEAHDEDAAERQQALGQLANSSALRQLPSPNIDELMARMEPMVTRAGEVIIHQGDPGDYFYLIETGLVAVTRAPEPGAEPAELVRLGPGAAFGEEALVSDNPRNANVVMVTDGRLLRLAKGDFVELMKEPLLNWIPFDAALAAIADGAELLDLRVPAEFEQGHLPGAENLPLPELRGRMPGLDPDLRYICYCNTGRRSSAGAFLLSQNGFRAEVLENGLHDVPNAYLIR